MEGAGLGSASRTLPRGNSLSVALGSDVLDYLAALPNGSGGRLPPIQDLAEELAISPGKLREQLEVARAMGFVEVRPRTGIRTLPFSFSPAVRASLRFALARDRKHFETFGSLRQHVEASFWEEAVLLLTPEDKAHLQDLISRAWAKLRGTPIEIPHAEHRDLHLTIYSRLENPFVRGVLEAYWDAYEAVGLNVYADYEYLTEVWTYHERMVEAIVHGDYATGHDALVQHTALLQARPLAGNGRLVSKRSPKAGR
jgi:DNA-binding FadR family transcriptional regulator